MSTTTPVAYYDLNSNLLKITGLKNANDGSWVNSGVTVTAKICPVNSTTAITNGTITLSYVAASNGNWQGTYPSTTPVVRNTSYDLIVTADGGVSLTGVWKIRIRAEERVAP